MPVHRRFVKIEIKLANFLARAFDSITRIFFLFKMCSTLTRPPKVASLFNLGETSEYFNKGSCFCLKCQFTPNHCFTLGRSSQSLYFGENTPSSLQKSVNMLPLLRSIWWTTTNEDFCD